MKELVLKPLCDWRCFTVATPPSAVRAFAASRDYESSGGLVHIRVDFIPAPEPRFKGGVLAFDMTFSFEQPFFSNKVFTTPWLRVTMRNVHGRTPSVQQWTTLLRAQKAIEREALGGCKVVARYALENGLEFANAVKSELCEFASFIPNGEIE